MTGGSFPYTVAPRAEYNGTEAVMRLKFAIVGGDARLALLAGLLRRDGNRVCTYALERAELPEDIPKAGCLQGCVYGADCVVLPTPAETGGFLFAPLSAEKLRAEELVGALWQGQRLFGGRLGDGLCLAALRQGLVVEDLLRRPDFAAGNEVLTAEGALGVLMAESDKSLWRSRVLVLGWGRIAKFLTLRLLGLGAKVGVAARRAEARVTAAALGAESFPFEELESKIAGFDFIVNTVPARVLSDGALCAAAEDAMILELASAPGGFDRSLAENIGLRAIAAPGLPGRCAPRRAAELMREAIYASLGEGEG